jgi:hypothetical protein
MCLKDILFPPLPWSKTSFERKAVDVKCESSALEGTESAWGKFVFWVGGGRVLVRFWVWGRSCVITLLLMLLLLLFQLMRVAEWRGGGRVIVCNS